MTYLITFAGYGWRLHGDEEGSIDREQNGFGHPFIAVDRRRVAVQERTMDQGRYVMDEVRRSVVLKALCDRCVKWDWMLWAAHVRSNHAHVVVGGERRPEKILIDLKAFASSRLREMGLDGVERKKWARHGSTRWLWKAADVEAAIRYVVHGQGEGMAVFERERCRK